MSAIEEMSISSTKAGKFLEMKFDNGKSLVYTHGPFTHYIDPSGNVTKDEFISLCIVLCMCGVDSYENIPSAIDDYEESI